MDEDHDQAVSNVPFRIGRAGSGNYDDDGENERLVKIPRRQDLTQSVSDCNFCRPKVIRLLLIILLFMIFFVYI